MKKTFDAQFIDPESYSPMDEINAFDFRKTPVITDENQREIIMFNWGLIPFWAKNDMIKKATLNAKIELTFCIQKGYIKLTLELRGECNT